MGMSALPSPGALGLSLVLIGVGALVSILTGLGPGAIVGGLIAAAGAVPAGYAAWQGMQAATQGALARALGALFLALAVGGVLIVVGAINWVR